MTIKIAPAALATFWAELRSWSNANCPGGKASAVNSVANCRYTAWPASFWEIEVSEDAAPPRFHPNAVHAASGPFDLTLTWLLHDPTVLPHGQEGPHEPRTEAILQTVLSYGTAKAMIPLLVKVIADYEQEFGPIPSPGFDELSKGS